MKTYIGIDPGLAGGVAVLDGDGRLESVFPIPVCLHGRRNTVDCRELYDFIMGFPLGDVVVVVESAQKHSPGKNALCSTWFGFGRITATLEILKVRHEIIATPLTWQKMFWTKPKMPKGQKFDTKAASIAAAKRLFPQESFLPTPRCKNPSDGLTDACLIAEYGRRKGL